MPDDTIGEGTDDTSFSDDVALLENEPEEELEETEEETEETEDLATVEDDTEDIAPFEDFGDAAPIVEEPGDDDDDELEGDAYIGPQFKLVKKKYPELFKEFPTLRTAFFRERAYTDVFNTPDDAKEAKRRLEVMEPIEVDLFENGSALVMLQQIHEVNPQAVQRVVTQFGDSVKQFDTTSYGLLVRPIVQELLQALVLESEKAEGKNGTNLLNTAKVISAFTGVQPAQKQERDPQLEQERAEIQQERARNHRERQTRAMTHVSNQTRTVCSRLIEKSLRADQFNEFTQSAVIQKTIDKLGKTLGADQRHIGSMNNLWQAAATAGYSDETVTNIIRTYVGRAKNILPEIIRRVKSDAARGVGRPTAKSGDRTNIPPRSGVAPKQRTMPKTGEIDWAKSSDMDILEGKVTTR